MEYRYNGQLDYAITVQEIFEKLIVAGFGQLSSSDFKKKLVNYHSLIYNCSTMVWKTRDTYLEGKVFSGCHFKDFLSF